MASNNNHKLKKVAILIENDVEDAEFQIPYNGLKQAKMDVVVLGARMNETYKGKRGKVSIQPDGTTTEAIAAEFDAVIIPGGMAPDKMRRNVNTVRFVKEAIAQNKLVAAVCHGPQLLIEADLLKDRKATGFIAIRQDMINAGANYTDEPVVIDQNLITSRQPGDLALFTTAILSRLGYGGKDAGLPEESDIFQQPLGDRNIEWWKLADAWGGSTKGDIVKGLNTALAGEKYSLEALQKYTEKESDSEIKVAFQEIIGNKERHIQSLEMRLNQLGEKPSLTANIANQYAKVKAALTGSDDIFQLRSALGDIQTGIGDVGNLMAAFTDPITTAIFTDIHKDLVMSEQRLVNLYRAKVGDKVKSANPTTGTSVSM
ncbi:PfpI family intracellular peptidase [Calothrix sp. NIES-4101]|nr:PfpI family intracellular peptidase [Calothrix sp. NIES-4101]